MVNCFTVFILMEVVSNQTPSLFRDPGTGNRLGVWFETIMEELKGG
jgi:hypothetical protein